MYLVNFSFMFQGFSTTHTILMTLENRMKLITFFEDVFLGMFACLSDSSIEMDMGEKQDEMQQRFPSFLLLRGMHCNRSATGVHQS